MDPKLTTGERRLPVEELLGDDTEAIDRQIAEGIVAEERGELLDGEQAMAEIRAELEGRPRIR